MSSLDFGITDNDKRVRKRWLFSTWFAFVIYPMLLFALCAVLSEQVPHELLGTAIGGLISLWIIWHCAYKHYGVNLISVWLFVSPFKMIISTVSTLKEECTTWIMIFSAINIGVFVWWYWLSLKMRKINKSTLILTQSPIHKDQAN